MQGFWLIMPEKKVGQGEKWLRGKSLTERSMNPPGPNTGRIHVETIISNLYDEESLKHDSSEEISKAIYERLSGMKIYTSLQYVAGVIRQFG